MDMTKLNIRDEGLMRYDWRYGTTDGTVAEPCHQAIAIEVTKRLPWRVGVRFREGPSNLVEMKSAMPNKALNMSPYSEEDT
ncbi:hypothetical protein B7494_g5253 [Chlorociboria aeruginascens]|nr:hypothetical protein B7494_g5253 [Chlorociboria aeruginascens]